MKLTVKTVSLDDRKLSTNLIRQLDLVEPTQILAVARYKPNKAHHAAVYVIGTRLSDETAVRSFAFASDRPHLMEDIRPHNFISASHYELFIKLDLVIV